MNFKGISAPLNAGRLEQLLGLVPPRHAAETTQSDGRSTGVDSANVLEGGKPLSFASLCTGGYYDRGDE